MSLKLARGRRRPVPIILALALIGVLFAASPVSAGALKQYSFTFENGTTISGTSDNNVAFLAGAGGTDANNPTGMDIHVSCSDKFESGFGEKDGPDPVADSAWKIESFSIGEVKNGVFEEKCSGPADPAAIDDGKGYTFTFVNGTIITGVSEDNVAFLAGAGGTDANNPTGMDIHVSCSDKFPGGFGEKDGPDRNADSAWQIESYEITEIKDGVVKEVKCQGSFGPPTPPPAPSVDLTKRVNGEDANTAPGVSVSVGDTVTLSYEVVNDGTIPLSNVVVTDADLGNIPCPKTSLAVGESMDCDERTMDVLQPGPVFMEARVDADGIVAGTPTPPAADKGKAYSFTFVNGTIITGVSEDNVAFLAGAGGTDANNPTGMDIHVSCSDKFPGGFGEKDGPDRIADSAWQIASFSIVKDGTTTCGETFQSVAIPVADEDPINYVAAVAQTPSIDLMKSVNGDDANSAPGPQFEVGDTITITYKITNTGNTDLSNIVVDDETFGIISCNVGTLSPGDMFTCPGVDEIVTEAGAVNMRADVEGTSPEGVMVVDDDPINFTVVDPDPDPTNPRIQLKKRVNGLDADNPPGPEFNLGDKITITYKVINRGDTDLSNIVVTDDMLGVIPCDPGTLAPGEKFECPGIMETLTETGPVGMRAVVEGTSPAGFTVNDDDPINFTVVDPDPASPSIDLMKSVNGDDANSAPGPQFEVGDTITITYKITNTGNTDLSNIVVDDETFGIISCNVGTLSPGDMFTCPGVDEIVTEAGAVNMRADVEGTSPEGVMVVDDDPINFTVVDPGPTLQPPTDCSVVADGQSIKVSWTASDGATKYAVERDGAYLGRTSTTMFIDDTAPAGATVSYAVRAIGADSKTDYVGCGSVTVPDGGDPQGPTSCQARLVAGGVEISWTAADGAKAYQVRANGQWLVRTTHLSFTDHQVRDNYTVEAIFPGNVKSEVTECQFSNSN